MSKEQELKEELLINLLQGLDDIVFVSSTDSVSGIEEDLNPSIEDREGTIVISGEWDREDLKDVLAKVFHREKEALRKVIEEKYGKKGTMSGSLGYQGLVTGITAYQTPDDVVRDGILDLLT